MHAAALTQESTHNTDRQSTTDVPKPGKLLIGWHDVAITSAVESLIVAPAGFAAYTAHCAWELGGAATALVAWIAFVAMTLVVLRVIRAIYPLKPGVYSFDRNAAAAHVFSIQGFLCFANLSFQHINGLIPPVLRKPFYSLMGGKFGPGIIPISGRIHDPWMVSVGENVQIGDDALILGHAMSTNRVVVLGRVEIQPDAVIGVRSVIMPGVTVGRGSIVNPMSFVPMHTQIPAYEVWGGIPAVKVRDLPLPKPTEQT